jgi:arsenite methyltransferase
MSALERLGVKRQDVSDHDVSQNQKQTSDIFGYKWKKVDSYESPGIQEWAKKWLLERYCCNNPDTLQTWLPESERKIILDAGCGSGFSTLLLFGELLKKHDYLGVDISDSVDVARRRFAERGINADFLKSDLMDLPIPDASVDMIFSEGVLHHTDSTEAAIRYLATKLKPAGYFLFYVYARKAAIREYTDDHIRNAIKDLSNDDAWEALKPLTKLGRALGELNVNIDIPEDISFLGIKKGTYNLQRFFYYSICKMFYRPDFSLEEMNHINFDWFRPMNCHRHTPHEIEDYCQKASLNIEHMDVQESGITVVARKEG